MKRLSKPIFQVLCLILFAVVGMSCVLGGTSLDCWRLWCGLQETFSSHRMDLLWAAALSLQLTLIKGTNAVWNLLFCLLSILFAAWLVTLAAGQGCALTSPLQEQLNAHMSGNLADSYPSALWLLPLLWFICCLCAKNQVRIFCTALLCYALWLGITALGMHGVQAWQAMENPPQADLLLSFTCCPWLIPAIPGLFLLIFALLMSLAEAFLPASPTCHEKTPSSPRPVPAHEP